jgi:dienelactone hydrolase
VNRSIGQLVDRGIGFIRLTRHWPANGASARPVVGTIAPDQFVHDFRSGWLYMKGQAFASAGRLGIVGFCFGGGVTWLVAEGLPELKAAVPFYGSPPPADKVPNIQAAVLALDFA